MKLPDLAVLNHKRSKGRSKMGLEGIVSKRLGSRYRSGRTSNWLKFKNLAAPAWASARFCSAVLLVGW